MDNLLKPWADYGFCELVFENKEPTVETVGY